VLAWYGFGITFKYFSNAEKDVRSLDMPRWMIVVWIPIAFFLMAVEFARFLWRRENFLAPMTDIA
jgi:TRAP-type C4-dicarboxylate transport system permease small subunit